MSKDPVKTTIYIDYDVAEALEKHVPWGLKGKLICAIARLITGAIKRDGAIMLGAIIDGKYKLVLDLEEDDRAQT